MAKFPTGFMLTKNSMLKGDTAKVEPYFVDINDEGFLQIYDKASADMMQVIKAQEIPVDLKEAAKNIPDANKAISNVINQLGSEEIDPSVSEPKKEDPKKGELDYASINTKGDEKRVYEETAVILENGVLGNETQQQFDNQKYHESTARKLNIRAGISGAAAAGAIGGIIGIVALSAGAFGVGAIIGLAVLGVLAVAGVAAAIVMKTKANTHTTNAGIIGRGLQEQPEIKGDLATSITNAKKSMDFDSYKAEVDKSGPSSSLGDPVKRTEASVGQALKPNSSDRSNNRT